MSAQGTPKPGAAPGAGVNCPCCPLANTTSAFQVSAVIRMFLLLVSVSDSGTTGCNSLVCQLGWACLADVSEGKGEVLEVV